ncbi:DUF1109 domain-containing protein [Alicycliphilus denitrificans]|uniref:DUF1109 domain-containing protein n=1 Tax=Alicycliphilus denitrificans TaxID=179636 RepID=UPI00384FCB85
MNTEELIRLLAADARPVPAHGLERRFALAVALGLAGAALLMLGVFGLRQDWGAVLVLPMFWGKFALGGALAVLGLTVVLRLARPGMPWGRAALWLALPPAVMWLLAGMVLADAEPPERLALLLGSTWRDCPFNIALLSLPALATLLWALRGAAPTRPAWAGAGAGLLAGALGVLAYALHCPEMAAPFVALWYLAGMALPTALGAALGPRLLRW